MTDSKGIASTDTLRAGPVTFREFYRERFGGWPASKPELLGEALGDWADLIAAEVRNAVRSAAVDPLPIGEGLRKPPIDHITWYRAMEDAAKLAVTLTDKKWIGATIRNLPPPVL